MRVAKEGPVTGPFFILLHGLPEFWQGVAITLAISPVRVRQMIVEIPRQDRGLYLNRQDYLSFRAPENPQVARIGLVKNLDSNRTISRTLSIAPLFLCAFLRGVRMRCRDQGFRVKFQVQ